MAGTVGIVAPFFSRWFFTQFMSGAEHVLSKQDMNLLLLPIPAIQGYETHFSQERLNGRLDGVIISGLLISDVEIAFLHTLNVPVVLTGIHHKAFSSVAIDDVGAARTATQHLVNLGHKKIGLLSGGPIDPYIMNPPGLRRKGFMQVLEESNIEWHPGFEVHGDFAIITSARAMDDLLARRNRPTAIFCESDEMAFGAIQSALQHGLRIPEDISIIGFDGHDLAEFANLTTISQPVRTLGEMAAWSLLERMKKPRELPPTLTLPTQLIVRNSTRRFEG